MSSDELFQGLPQEAKQAAQETGAEMRRLGVQGTAELAQALFSNSNAYVPYGQGQNANSQQQQQEQERGGMSR